MPRCSVEVSAELLNIQSIAAPDDYPWHLFLMCCNCGEKTDKPIVISKNEEVSGIRGASVNLKISCKLCKRVNDMKILPGKHVYTAEDNGWVQFLQLECRGVEPTELLLADDVPFEITGLQGASIEDGFIEDGEFYSYDESTQTEVSITEFETRIVKG